MTAFFIVFVLCALYSVAGNIAVRIMLAGRNVQTKFWLRGIPGYLYRVCAREKVVSQRWRQFAFSTDIAFAVCFLSVFVFVGTASNVGH